MADTENNKNSNSPALRFPRFSDPWKKFALGDIGTSLIGLTYSPNDVVQENGIIVLRSSNIQEGALDFNDVVRVSKKIRPSLFTQEEDILICSRNGSARLIGKNAIIPKSYSGLTFGAFMMVYRSNQNRFIHHLLNTKRYQTQVSENLGARINQITSSDLNSFEFFFPCEKEQNKIAKFIDLIDERIATQRRLIEDLEKLKSSINETLYARLTTDYMTSFNEIGSDYSGLTGKSAEDFGRGKPFITYLNVYQNKIITDCNFDYVEIRDGENQNKVLKGDLLFTLSSETPEETGYSAVYLGDANELYLNSFCFGIHIPESEMVYPPYMGYFTSTSYFRRKIIPYAQGSTRFNLHKPSLMSMKFSLPAKENQIKIFYMIQLIAEKISTEKKLLVHYIQQRDYLLAKLFI